MNGDAPTLRDSLEMLLRQGLQTQWRERAYDLADVARVAQELSTIAPADYARRLDVAGFTLEPYTQPQSDIEESCRTCMYFSRHREFCSLPALKLPVKAHWSCRLWRI